MAMRFLLLLLLLSAMLGSAANAQFPSNLDGDTLRGLPSQHDGRWPPLDTVARDYLESVTGSPSLRGADPVLTLLAWTFDPETWRKEPLIGIGNAELRRELKLPADRDVFSFNELVSHQPLRVEMTKLSSVGDRKMNPLERKVSDIQGKLGELDTVFRGEAIRIIPDPADGGGAWSPVGPSTATASDAHRALYEAWTALRTSFLAGDSAAFEKASRDVVANAAALPAAFRPAPGKIKVELAYNRIHPFGISWKLLAAGAVLSAVGLFVRQKWFDIVSVAALVVGFGLLNFGLWQRWQIAGRIPAANMYESLLFMSWGTVLFAIISLLAIRDRLVPFTASMMGFLALMLADVLPLDGFVRPAPPVLLDTIWMTIHVPVIMVSYGVLAIAVLMAHIQIVAMAVVPSGVGAGAAGKGKGGATASGGAGLVDEIDRRHYWYVHVGSILLLIGIVTGSMWAASSWGRYWGWDPKEVWSLVALLGYLAALHVRIDTEKSPRWIYGIGAILAVGVFAMVVPKLEPLHARKILYLCGAAFTMVLFVVTRDRFATAMKSIVAFWLIIMTYVGVNFVLGTGLHSYGFGTGAMVKYLFRIGTADLLLIAACALLYLVRRRSAGMSLTGPVTARRPA